MAFFKNASGQNKEKISPRIPSNNNMYSNNIFLYGTNSANISDTKVGEIKTFK